MPKIIPFRAVHYNPKMIADLAQVITPPYDNIPDKEIPVYKNRSPYNFAHVILPIQEEVPYTKALNLISQWREQSILVQDKTPSLYIYQQVFKVNETTFSRSTLMAPVLLSEFSDGKILPHENTHTIYKEDRLAILRKTRMNLSHIFAMVRDTSGFLASIYEPRVFAPALLSAKTTDGIVHGIWQIPASEAKDLVAFFEDKPLYILDGHHRYSSALMYAKEKGVLGNPEHPAAYMLFAIANSFDTSLKVFPTHRCLKNIGPENFDWETFERTFDYLPMTEEELKKFTETPVNTPRFGLWLEKKLYLCMAKDWSKEQERRGKTLGKFPVLWSDDILLGDILKVPSSERATKIGYERSWEIVWKQRHSFPLAIFHAPPVVDSVAQIAEEKGVLPQKSTFFYPKLAAGLILREV